MKGKPAMAASLCARGSAEFDTAARVTVRVAEWMRNHPLPRGAVYSVNIPMLPMKEIKGIRAARLAPNYLDTPLYREISTPDGIQYQYIHGRDVVPLDKPEYDIVLVGEGYVTVTKLTWDMRLNAPDPEIPDAILTEVRHEPV